VIVAEANAEEEYESVLTEIAVLAQEPQNIEVIVMNVLLVRDVIFH
jgi:hypothetical protein